MSLRDVGLRSLSIMLVISCGTTQKREPENGSAMPEGSLFTGPAGPVSDRRFREGPGGFPLPADATGCRDMPNRDLVCKIPRARDAVHDELTGYLKERGFKVRYTGKDGTTVLDGKQELAGGYRMTVESATANYLVSVTTNDSTSTLLTITVK